MQALVPTELALHRPSLIPPHMEPRNASDHPPDALRVFDLDLVYRLQPDHPAVAASKAHRSTCNFAETRSQQRISHPMLAFDSARFVHTQTLAEGAETSP